MFLGLVLLVAGMVQAADGVPIRYEVEGKGEPALVFIPCWGCTRKLWENQVPRFSKTHRVVTIDLPGHGESGKNRKQWSIQSFGDDVTRVVKKLGLRRVVLIGSSMGAPVALEAARIMPDRVIGIVPVDSLLDVDQVVPPDQRDAVMAQLRADYRNTLPRMITQMLFAPGTPTAVRERIIADALAMPGDVALPMLDAVISYNAIESMKVIKVPIRAINADLGPTNFAANRKYAPQFDAVIMKGVGHYPMLEDPVKFNELLSGVLQDISRAKRPN